MPKSSAPLVALLLLALTSASCMMGWWWSRPEIDRPSYVLDELRASQERYSDDCARWDIPDDAGAIPDRHVDDVYLLTDDMVEACNDLMDAERIDRVDRDRIAGLRVRIRDAVDAHRHGFDDLEDGTAMHDECTAHHREMLDLFDEAEAFLRAGGMMRGSGMT